MQGSKCSQTLYLCLVTGRIFFYLSPPTSKLNDGFCCLGQSERRYGHLPTTSRNINGSDSTYSSTPTIQSFHEVTEAQVGDELIGYCITPRNLTVVKNILQCEQHKYSLTLLPYIFTREMSSSNTEGTHKKLPLDTTKMNSLIVLVFNRFLSRVSREERNAVDSIKGKVDPNCHTVPTL